jgi:hypothetical protein
MKQKNKQLAFFRVLVTGLSIFLFAACQKDLKTTDPPAELKSNSDAHGHLVQTNTYTSDVAVKWLNMQIRLARTATGITNVLFFRPYSYSGIALYEAVVPGMPSYQSLAGQLTDLSGMPQTEPGLAYHWAGAANAALASINKQMFPTTSDANKAAIDSLEAALNQQYQNEVDQPTLDRSIAFGKAVAQKIFEWAQADGYQHVSDPYIPPTGAGLWEPTPPAFAAASTPYWGNLRVMVPGSGDNAQPGAPTPYSTDPSSDFYKMVKQVYDASQTLTAEQTAQALYWRDIPGVTTPGHYASILMQVLEIDKSPLSKAAVAYALAGITGFDASVSCWQTKYHYNLVRPITYIRAVLGYSTWNSLLATPAHPEYSSAHAVASSATAGALTNVFGDNFSFADHTYDYLGFAPRPFNSFEAFGEDAGNSRLYAGIHYQPSIDTGFVQGRRISQNISSKLIFLKQ